MTVAKEGLFDGTYCWFIKEKGGAEVNHEWVGIGTCNADDQWKALDKFERGLGMAHPMTRGKRYKITRSGGFDAIAYIQFVY